MKPRQPAACKAASGAKSHSAAHPGKEALTDKDDRKIDSRLVRVHTCRVFCGSVPQTTKEKGAAKDETTVYLRIRDGRTS